MKRSFLILFLLTALEPCVLLSQQPTDTYGGVLAQLCPTDTASWSTQLVGKNQVFCTPTIGNSSGHSHVFNIYGVWFVAGDTHDYGINTTSASVTGNTATLTLSSNPISAHWATGIQLTVTGFTGADTYFNGVFTISTLSSNQVTYSLNHANAIASTNGRADVYVPVSYNTLTATKYGNSNTQWNSQFARLINWGFNVAGPGSFRHATDSFITNKIPFVEYGNGGATGAVNVHVHCIKLGNCKNFWNLTTDTYSPNHFMADVYDPSFQSFSNTEYNADPVLAAFKGSPYWLGYVQGDTDNYSCWSGAENTAPGHPWTTDPPDSSWSSCMIHIARSAPRQMTNPENGNAVFSDPVNYTKIQWCNFLQSEYVTAAAWNSAWGTGTFYTGFGSDATQVTGAALSGSGNGPYTIFAHANIDPYSVLILVNGVGVAGDSKGSGAIEGPSINTATATYSSGIISITFTSPPAGAVTVNYQWGGFVFGGHQCLDESGPNIGNGDNTGAPGATPQQVINQVTDLDNFLVLYANKSNSVPKTSFLGLFSGAPIPLYFSISNLGQVPGRDPSRCSLITGTSQVVDVMILSVSGAQDQANFVGRCGNDKIWVNWETLSAQNDWTMYAVPAANPGVGTWDHTNQTTRGVAYQADMTNFRHNCNQTTGVCSWAGFIWWAFLSLQFPEFTNFGLVDWNDNAFDAHENQNTTGTFPCSPPLAAFTCGGTQPGQSANGNFFSSVITANQGLNNDLANLGVPPTAPCKICLVSKRGTQ